MNNGNDEKLNRPGERSRLLEVQSWLAEYEALHNEILNSQRYGEMLIELNIIALAVVLGLVVTARMPSFALILTLSVICSCLGLLWVHENRRSLACSGYITNRIAPSLRELTGNPEIFSAESLRYGEPLESSGKALGNLLSETDSPQQKGELSSQDRDFQLPLLRKLPILRTTITGLGKFFEGNIEFLVFFVPGLSGIIAAIYGMVSAELWHWYYTLLFVAAVILTGALAVAGQRWHKEWHITRALPVEEVAAEERNRVETKL